MKNTLTSIGFVLSCLINLSCEAQLPFYNIPMPEEWKDEGKLNDFNKDNKIYRGERVFSFQYQYIDSADTEKISIINTEKFTDGGEFPWELIEKGHEKDEEYPIKNIDLIVYKTKSKMDNFLQDQTIIRYKYYNENGEVGFGSLTGLIEDSSRIWLHPPRDFAFKITEFNPFPEVELPLKVGKAWNRSISIPATWAEGFNFTINGSTSFEISLKITSKEKIKTKIGELTCYIIEGLGKGELGETKSRFYFNEEAGFVKLEYRNLDKSKLIIDLISIK
jgi:hypothetical protein